MGARSRSRSDSSDSDSPRVDQFGRLVPKKKKSRSRSRGRRSRSRSRHRSRRSRSRSRGSSRSLRHSRSSSHRRSRSRSPRSRPIRPIIIFNRRSRSRSRGRSPRRKLPRRQFRRDSHDRLVSCSPESEKSPTPEEPRKPSNETNLNDPELQKARVFIGNLPYDKITKEELEEMFGKYGKILGISIHERGFGFVQFSKEEEGSEAVANENGGLLKGNKILVKMAFDGRKGSGKPPPSRRSPPPAYDRGYPVGGTGRGPAPPRPGAPDTSDRESYPPPVARDPAGYPSAADRARERSPLRADPYEDRYRDPYRDARDPALPPPPRRDDPYYADPYRRPPPPDDPYYDRYRDDPYRYRRDPYADPYRDPYYRDYPPYETPPKKPLPIDCEIISLSANLKNFAEFLERKIKALGLQVAIVVIPEDRTIPQMIEDSSKRSVLFAIVINSQNEVHQSLTLNILHGIPQEHRNMPVEDAINLINRSFEQYMQTAREKSTSLPPAASTGAPASTERAASAPFVPPNADISYLLNLLADSRQLTIEELDKVIVYLQERRDKLLEADGRRPTLDDGRAGYGGAGDRKDEAASLNQQQQELQAKILSILNGPGEEGPHPPTEKRLPPRGGLMGNGSHQQPGGQGGMSSLINFDSPSVQKALDNLIQSGPNLLKNISSPQGGASMTQQTSLMSRHGGEPVRRDPSQHGMMMREQGYGGLGGAAAGHSGIPQAGGTQSRPMYSSAGMGAPGGVQRPAGPPASRRPY